jgi:hypothetical protein
MITIESIEYIICKGENLTPSEIHIKDKRNEIAECRQIISYFAREMTKMSLYSIGAYFGLDHATAYYSCKTVKNHIETEKKYKAKIDDYEIKIKEIVVENTVIRAKTNLQDIELEIMQLETRIIDLKKLLTDVKYELVCLQ